MTEKTVFITADHGLAVFYFLQSDIIQTLLDAGVQVVVLTGDETRSLIEKKFGQPGLVVEGLRMDAVRNYMQQESPAVQWWLDYLRRAGASTRINRAVPDAYQEQVRHEAHPRRRRLLPIMEALAAALQNSKAARSMLMRFQRRFTPTIYTDLFDKYQPDLVVAGSPGFRNERYLLREAHKRGITNVAAIISWDSSSSYGLPGADVDRLVCWSELQKSELVDGADWDPDDVQVVGMPPYDGYVRDTWLLSRGDYFRAHNLDPGRKLLSYASSFVSWSPNIQNVQALVELVTGGELIEPAQLLVRLHPIHMDGYYVQEAERIRQFARENEHVHVVEPVPLGDLGHYSGEDMTEKTSMMAHSDVFLTVYSTMVVEAAFQQTPTVGVTIDSNTGYEDKYWVPMSQIGVWPTHSRFRTSGGGRVASTKTELKEAINSYFADPRLDLAEQQAFLEREVTYTDGSSGQRAAEFFLSILAKGQ